MYLLFARRLRVICDQNDVSYYKMMALVRRMMNFVQKMMNFILKMHVPVPRVRFARRRRCGGGEWLAERRRGWLEYLRAIRRRAVRLAAHRCRRGQLPIDLLAACIRRRSDDRRRLLLRHGGRVRCGAGEEC